MTWVQLLALVGIVVVVGGFFGFALWLNRQ